MSSVKTLNPAAEIMGRNAALFMNIDAAKVLESNIRHPYRSAVYNLGGTSP
jgi:hypothetical protein